MTVALQQQPSLLRTSTARGQPRLVRKRENSKHSSLLGRLRLSYARRGSTPAPSSLALSTPKEAVAAVPSPESSNNSSNGGVENQQRAPKKPKFSQDSSSSIPTTTTAAHPTAILLPKKRLAKRFRCSVKKGAGVLSGSLVGAKRSVVDLAPPSEEGGCGYCDYSSDEADEDSSMVSASSSDRSSSSSVDEQRRRRRLVRFAPRCRVTEIPHHSQYSPQQREQQWSGRRTIRSRARINTFEYQHDGWKLETAAEEDDFVEFEGEKYHPAHKYTHQYIMMSSTSNSAAAGQRE